MALQEELREIEGDGQMASLVADRSHVRLAGSIQMKKLIASALVALLAVQPASAQIFPSIAVPRYVSGHAEVRSQLDAMTPHSASAPAASDADWVSAPHADDRYLRPSIDSKPRSNREQRARPHATQPIRAAASAVSTDPYRDDVWDADRAYAYPEKPFP